jgi:uncharacterized protein
MKILILFTVLASCLVHVRNFTGKCNGILKVQGMELPLVFQISWGDPGLHEKMDDADQKAFGFDASATKSENSVLKIEIAKLGVPYLGKYKPRIEGFYKSAQLKQIK